MLIAGIAVLADRSFVLRPNAWSLLNHIDIDTFFICGGRCSRLGDVVIKFSFRFCDTATIHSYTEIAARWFDKQNMNQSTRFMRAQKLVLVSIHMSKEVQKS